MLARDSPLRARLRMDAWLEQLLYIAADAAATVRHARPPYATSNEEASGPGQASDNMAVAHACLRCASSALRMFDSNAVVAACLPGCANMLLGRACRITPLK